MKPQDHGPTKPEDRPDVAAGHERSDFAPKPVAWFGVALLVLLGVVFAIGWPLMHYYDKVGARAAARERQRLEPGSGSRVHLVPQAGENGAPLLQIVPEEELAEMRDRDAAELLAYGWIDRSQNLVRLPIARAMDLIAERGLPPTGPATRTMLEMQREPHPIEDQPRPKQ